MQYLLNLLRWKLRDGVAQGMVLLQVELRLFYGKEVTNYGKSLSKTNGVRIPVKKKCFAVHFLKV